MAAFNPVRVLVCNKYTLFREGITALLREGIPMEIVAETSTAGEAIRLVERLRPDVVLLDATTPDSSGPESTRRIRSIDSSVAIVIVSMNDDEQLRAGCMEAGATGYIGNADPIWHLKRVINNACGRGTRASHEN